MSIPLNIPLQQLRSTRPLILIISNIVTLDFIANGLLALGASPIVCCTSEEIETLVDMADAVLINIGTLNPKFLSLAHAACQVATQQQKPLVLDPVGVAATAYRRQAAQQLLQEYTFRLCRGNASEIMALADINVTAKGVDSASLSEHAVSAAKRLSLAHDITTVISGAADYVVSENTFLQSTYGHIMMTQITGSGCLLTAIIAAFLSCHQDTDDAALAAVQFYGMCGEVAARECSGPGQFKVRFLDALAEK